MERNMADNKPETKPTTDAAAAAAQESKLTAADAAKRVKRSILERVPDGKDGDGKPKFREVIKQVPVTAAEVLTFKDYGTHVVVVTKDGQKFSSVDA
jgi:hypothetical protein